MAEHREPRQDFRWIAVLALLAAGGAALYGRLRPRARRESDSAAAEPVATGRGRPLGPPTTTSLEHGYETVDANVVALAFVMVTALVLMGGGLVTVFTMYSSFAKADRASGQAMTAEQKAPIMPPEPRLQDNPYRDLDTAIMEQNQVLTTYGWADSDHKRARIPIERAMSLVVGKPLDGQAQASPPAGAGAGAAP